MKIIFLGTPDFSATVLEKLHSSYPVSTVVTGLDKPVGRGNKLTPSPLKVKAQELGIPVLQYNHVSKDGINEIQSLEPDVAVTAAFGQILSERFLSIPKFGTLNVHASLLPAYRGASPIQGAILNGDSESGITIMRTVKEVDAGDILLQKRTTIGEKETAGELFERLSHLGGEAIVEAISLLEQGKATFIPQDASAATHCCMISKADGKINFNKTAHELDCFVRGMTPWPSAYCTLDGKILKVYSISRYSSSTTTASGSVIAADTKQGLIVSVKDGAVSLDDIQLEGSKRMSAKDFLRGRSIEEGYTFQ